MNTSRYKFLLDGKQYQEEYLHLIREAKNSIYIHTYIFKNDSFGGQVIDELKKQASKGVKIYVLIDYIGSFDFDLKKLKFQNIDVRFFNTFKVFNILKSGRRLHQKILVVDKSKAIIGGINIIDSFIENEEPRLDFAISLVDKKIVSQVYQYCSDLYEKKKVKQIVNKKKIKVLINDWYKEKSFIFDSTFGQIKRSKKEIILIHGYFLPSVKVFRLIRKKAKQNLDIKILLPRKSDWRIWVWATSHLYSKLITSGVKVYEWPYSHLHGKLAIFDCQKINTGSYNMNYMSDYGNIELNLSIDDEEFVKNICERELKDIFKKSSLIKLENLNKRNFLVLLRNFLSFYLLIITSKISVNLIWFGRQLRL